MSSLCINETHTLHFFNYVFFIVIYSAAFLLSKKLTTVILHVYLSSKHRCPHRPYGIVGKSDQPCAVTEYRSEFVPREGGARESFKPEFTLQSSTAPLEDETTHKYV